MRRYSVLIVVALVGCVALENRLVYQPRRETGELKDAPPPLQNVELRSADGLKLHARWWPQAGATGAILFCHGNAGNLEGRAKAVHDLGKALGESVLIFDYPGYGRSEGNPSESGCVAAADAAFRWLTDEQHIPAERVLLFGESLGGGVAVEQARRSAHRALILARTFTSIPDVAQAHFSSLPTHALMVNRYDSLAKIGGCTRPIFIAAADRDRVVPFAHGEKLYQACRSPAELLRMEGLGHNDPLPREFYVKLKTFLDARAPVGK